MAAGGLRRRVWQWLSGSDGKAVSILVGLPLLLFVVPALAGHSFITGDNLIQNFPLRALSGRQLGQGHLPLWNPYIWSGSPLLGGLNAGSLYPFTIVFAVVPPVAAWVFGLLGIYWAGGLGCYALARTYRLRPVASLAGALAYAFGGAMVGQVVHLGVAQGMGWMPLLVLALLRLSWAVLGTGPVLAPAAGGAGGAGGGGGGDGPESPLRERPAHWGRCTPWPWVGLLAACVGLQALTGEPRAMAETEVVSMAVVAWLVLRPYAGGVATRLRVALVGWAVLAGVWGAALSAVELAPGWSFIRASQRSAEGYHFFGTGSLKPSFSALLFVPDLGGGSGIWGQPKWLSRYNLAEVTGYVGLLALVAVAALLTRSFGRRRSALSSDWGMWLALAGFGLLLSFGSFTVLGHLWAQIPLFGQTRLQSRNLGIVDLGLAVALAFWADRALRGRLAEAALTGWRRLVTLAPLAVSALLCLAVLVFPVGTEEHFGADAAGAPLAHYLRLWMLLQLALVAGATWLVLGWGRGAPRWRRAGLGALLVADLALFVTATSPLLLPASSTVEPTTAMASSVLGSTGRFAIYDTSASHVAILSAVGQPDLNAFTRLSAVQGYGSIVSEDYATATGTHALDTLTTCALAKGEFGQLRLASLITLPQFLAPQVPAHGAPAPPATCKGAAAPGTATTRTLYLGQVVDLRSAHLVSGAHAGGAVGSGISPTPRFGSTMRVGVLQADGHRVFPESSITPAGSGWTVRFDRPVAGVGLVLRTLDTPVSATSTVTGTTSGVPGRQRWAFDGILQNALGQSGWTYKGMWGEYSRFAATSVFPPVWVAANRGTDYSCDTGPCSPAEVRQVSTSDWGTEVDRVDARDPVTVVRSVAWLQGWKAELQPVGGGPVRTLGVERHGLVQAVRVPRGRWVLTFVYRPPHLTAGLAASAVAAAGFVGLGAGWVVRRRRRRLRSAPAGGAGAGAPVGTVSP